LPAASLCLPSLRPRSSRLFGTSVLIFAGLLFSSQLALAQFAQQGSKLVNGSAVGLASQGTSVALENGGHTPIIGGANDNSGTGAVWVDTPPPPAAAKLVGTGAVGNAQQGMSVALSKCCANTLIVGGPHDNPSDGNNLATASGAAWIFSRSGIGVWSQQGSKLVGTGAVESAQQGAQQGMSVAVSDTVAAHARSAALPDVPTAAESGLPGFEATFYYGLSAPAGTPRPIIERLNKELRSMIESEEMTKRIVADGGDPIASTPEEYAVNIEREEGKWAALIKKLGLKIE
jgi:hypothetical protein